MEKYMTSTKEILMERLLAGVETIKFIKADGSERIMRATLSPEYIRSDTIVDRNQAASQVNTTLTAEIQPKESQVVWDVDQGAWRTFRWDRLKND
jgi:hypothetical protein